MIVVIASNNVGKVKEYKELLAPFEIKAVSQSEVGINIDIKETGTTFEENAKLKAVAINQLYNFPVIADDSGLQVKYLNNAPDIYSKRFCDGTDIDRNNKILSELTGIEQSKRSAKYVCSICYIDNNKNIKCFTDECSGYIGTKMTGENGFGYDSIFMVGDKSMAELTSEEKNTISHRAKAIKQLINYIKEK